MKQMACQQLVVSDNKQTCEVSSPEYTAVARAACMYTSCTGASSRTLKVSPASLARSFAIPTRSCCLLNLRLALDVQCGRLDMLDFGKNYAVDILGFGDNRLDNLGGTSTLSPLNLSGKDDGLAPSSEGPPRLFEEALYVVVHVGRKLGFSDPGRQGRMAGGNVVDVRVDRNQ